MYPPSKSWNEKQAPRVRRWVLGWGRILALCLMAAGCATAMLASTADQSGKREAAIDGSGTCVAKGANRAADDIREEVVKELEADGGTHVIAFELDRNYKGAEGSCLINTIVERAGRTFQVGVLVKVSPLRSGEVNKIYTLTYFD